MKRIDYPDLDQASDELREMLASRRPLNIYRMLPWGGPAAAGFLRMGGAILRESELDPKLREIAIIRVGVLSGAGYEVHQHKRVGRSVGLTDAQIDAIEQGDAGSAAFDDLQQRVFRFTDVVVRDVRAPDAMWHDLLERLGGRRMAELVMTIGFYMLVSRFLENFGVEIEPADATGSAS
jgi:alkylhydroperoxidase family enzyme